MYICNPEQLVSMGTINSIPIGLENPRVDTVSSNSMGHHRFIMDQGVWRNIRIGIYVYVYMYMYMCIGLLTCTPNTDMYVYIHGHVVKGVYQYSPYL